MPGAPSIGRLAAELDDATGWRLLLVEDDDADALIVRELLVRMPQGSMSLAARVAERSGYVDWHRYEGTAAGTFNWRAGESRTGRVERGPAADYRRSVGSRQGERRESSEVLDRERPPGDDNGLGREAGTEAGEQGEERA